MTQVGAVRGLPVRVSPSSIVTSRIDPAYPMEMRVQGIPGYVKLEVAVDDQGNVVAATVLEANRREFADAAMHAVSAWRFVAADESEMDCLRRVRIPIRFALTLPN
jgi:TonB family protein